MARATATNTPITVLPQAARHFADCLLCLWGILYKAKGYRIAGRPESICQFGVCAPTFRRSAKCQSPMNPDALMISTNAARPRRFRSLLFLVKIVLHVWREVDRRKEHGVADNQKAADYNHDDQLLIHC